MSNSATVTNFLSYFTPANGNYGKVDSLLTSVFSPESGTGTAELPCVAVTQHGFGIGPAFYGKKKVTKLFNRFFNAFDDLTLAPLGGQVLLLTSTDGNTIAIQLTITGTHGDWWFPPGDKDKFYSKPLSDIAPANITLNPGIAACAVFTFGANSLVNQLAMYLDRYKFIEQLSPSQGTNLNSVVTAAIQPVSQERQPESHERKK
jgi:hypothetical protein